MTLKWPFFVILTLLLPVIAYSQTNNNPAFWDSIETAIRGKKQLVDNYKRLDDIKTTALLQKDYNIYARARYCQLLITDLKTEDSLFWQNATFIDSILLGPHTGAALQLPMHIMLAHRLQTFKGRSAYLKAGYYKGDIYNYTSLKSSGLDSAIQYHYEQAKSFSAANGDTAPEKYLWLSSNPLLFLFKPTLSDIVQAEQIAYNTSVSLFDNSWKKRFCHWLQLSPSDFIKALDTVKSNGRHLQVLKLYSNWLALHKNDTAAFYFLESVARKYIYELVQSEKDSKSTYEKYLQAQTESPIKEVKAHCVYQLCLLWYSRSLMNYVNVSKMPPAKALQLYETNRSLFDDFSYLGSILEEMKAKILKLEIKWRMDKVAISGEPFLAQIEYKNATNLHYRIIPVRQNERIDSRYDLSIKYLLSKPFLRAVNETLPVTDDHDKHSVLVKVDALPAGKYRILFSPNEITGFESGVSEMAFEVSQISIVTSGNRVYVLNRKNGHSLQGARVTIDYDESDKTTEHIIGREGYIDIKRKEDYDIEVSYGKDTADDYDETASQLNRKLWDKESDELIEFYTDNAHIHILTDRSIYRPGQTVYYKGILMTKQPYTGEDIIINKKNLQQGPFRNILKKWLEKEKPELYISDAYNRKVDTLKLSPNAYGSITGSYRIPTTAAVGDWEIESNIDKTSHRSSSFSVEEYKRPTFELTEEKPVRSYLPGDTIAFKLKVRSFSGGTMANTKITYSIQRVNANFTYDGSLEKLEYDSVVNTGENGLVDLIVPDAALRNASSSLPDSVVYSFSYKLSATAIDQAGESHSLNTYLVVSNRPVNIKIPVKGKYFIGDFKPLLVTANDQNKVDLLKEIKVKLYREREGQANSAPMVTWFADQWKYTKEQLEKWFPHVQFDRERWEEPELVYETTIKTGTGEKLRIPANILTSGVYVIKAACYENDVLRGETKGEFTICDTVSRQIPGFEPSFFHVPFNNCTAGDSVLVYAGSAFDSTLLYLQLQYYSRTNKKLHVASVYRVQMVNAGVHLFKFRIPEDATEQAAITTFFIRNNEVYRHGEKIFVSKPSAYPSIIIEQFRSKLTPGQQTTFTVSVKTRDHKLAAELMSTMYDASLDKLNKHTWEAPYFGSLGSLDKVWPQDFKGQTSGDLYRNYKVESDANKAQLWWMPHFMYVLPRSLSSYYDEDVMGDWNNGLQGVAAGLDITQTAGLSDVVVVGYGTSVKRYATSSVKVTIIKDDITIKALVSLVGDKKPLVLLDGVPINADMSAVNVAEVTEVMMLTAAEATALYGSQTASGVIIISTKGPIKLPEVKQEPIVKVRSNFNELAFFYPALYAGRDGYYRFTFTMPEALTEWNWKLFAHTKNAHFAYAERKLTTQLPFMVQPNMPRQLYQGDRLVLKTRINNLDSLHKTGKVICKAEDVVTGEDISALILKNKENSFDLAAHSNTVTGFTLNVPVNQLNPIKIIIKATAGEYSDGEEHVIPVMTDKVLVKQVVQFSTSYTDTAIKLPAVKDVYGVGLSIQPKPQGALINSLPYLANYSFDCAEQTFNKMLANVTALGIMRTDTSLQKLYTKAKQAAERTDAPLLTPGLLNEQAMPWLQLNSRSVLQQKQLASLLDTALTKNTIGDHVEKLRSLQKDDGGLSWFEGGNSDEYITAYVLAGFGKLANDPGGADFLKVRTTSDFIYKLVQYLDDTVRYNGIYSIYARGYWEVAYPVTQTRLAQLQQIIKQKWEQGGSASLYQQALLIITTMQWFGAQDIYYKKALQQLEHIRQQAIEDPANGIRWKALADETDMTISAEETLALLAEAYGKTGNAILINEGITKWLLSSKPDHQWHSTKAAAAAIGILQQSQGRLTGTPDNIVADLNGQTISVTNNLLSGEPLAFVKTNSAPKTLAIMKGGSRTVSGNSLVYYFQSASQLNQLNTDIQLSKKLFIYNDEHKNWLPISDTQVLKIADRVKVVLTIESSMNLPYVYIDDKSGGAFEAADLHSGYHYGDRIGYYLAVRDAGMQFFASLIPAGKTDISYELKVTQEGMFTNGPASLQCMYKPEKVAYSNSALINTKE